MKIIKKSQALTLEIKSLKSDKNTIGFVPTMGALHAGHLSLVKESRKNCSKTVVSIFVNPTQFNNPADLEKYPRMVEKDLDLLDNAGVDIVFLPSEDEMYPEKDNRTFDFGGLENQLEGKFRPGHFNGVAQIVSKLLEICLPDKAFFGKKDYQQFEIIKSLIAQLNLPIEIVGCPILREFDGLAMSSRNLRIEKQKRQFAPEIYKSLELILKNSKNHKLEYSKKLSLKFLQKTPELKIEYFEIVNPSTFRVLNDWQSGINLVCIAAFLGDIRLIDNVEIKM